MGEATVIGPQANFEVIGAPADHRRHRFHGAGKRLHPLFARVAVPLAERLAPDATKERIDKIYSEHGARRYTRVERVSTPAERERYGAATPEADDERFCQDGSFGSGRSVRATWRTERGSTIGSSP